MAVDFGKVINLQPYILNWVVNGDNSDLAYREVTSEKLLKNSFIKRTYRGDYQDFLDKVIYNNRKFTLKNPFGRFNGLTSKGYVDLSGTFNPASINLVEMECSLRPANVASGVTLQAPEALLYLGDATRYFLMMITPTGPGNVYDMLIEANDGITQLSHTFSTGIPLNDEPFKTGKVSADFGGGNVTLKVEVDGIVSENTVAASFDFTGMTTDLSIGQISTGTNRFRGDMKDVKVSVNSNTVADIPNTFDGINKVGTDGVITLVEKVYDDAPYAYGTLTTDSYIEIPNVNLSDGATADGKVAFSYDLRFDAQQLKDLDTQGYANLLTYTGSVGGFTVDFTPTAYNNTSITGNIYFTFSGSNASVATTATSIKFEQGLWYNIKVEGTDVPTNSTVELFIDDVSVASATQVDPSGLLLAAADSYKIGAAFGGDSLFADVENIKATTQDGAVIIVDIINPVEGTNIGTGEDSTVSGVTGYVSPAIDYFPDRLPYYTNINKGTLLKSLVEYKRRWNINEDSAKLRIDYIGYQGNQLVVKTTESASEPVVFGIFNGSTSNIFWNSNLDNSALATETGDLVIEVRFRRANTSPLTAPQFLISHQSTGVFGFFNTGGGFTHFITSGFGGSPYALDNPILDTEWHILRVEYPLATNPARVYVDGTLQSSSGGAGGPGAPNWDVVLGPTSLASIGMDTSSASFFEGDIDYVKYTVGDKVIINIEDPSTGVNIGSGGDGVVTDITQGQE